MSPTYTAAVIQLLVIALPAIGVKVGSDQLTITIQTIVVVGSALVIAIRRFVQGDITVFGTRV